ncbi:hypothetical protein [Arcicella rosea]|uniref:Uncharacterized protein n=1 Tax=Arcicella rosea TaxID=502909 RepID=A0A841EHZ7_9BACT|nr:hypothetical protein [Arcicella rosea]MBB6003827.1 hypothetical protein [Arcicella rosea]
MTNLLRYLFVTCHANASHIFELREMAKQLEIEIKNVIDNAKEEIEKMIIG